jgi:DNA-directed RNA polymerase specialized sigma24 family protein
LRDLAGSSGNLPQTPASDDTARTATIHRVPDGAGADYTDLFEQQYRKSLFDAALERVREKFSLKQFQIFDLLVAKEWPAAQVAQSLGVTLANVYVTRHRISAAIKKETRRLESQLAKSDAKATSGYPEKV